MKKSIIYGLSLALSMIALSQAFATPVTYTFYPFDNSGQLHDMNDLDHYKFYVWEINNFSLATDQHIVGASLILSNIYDYQDEANDKLYIHVLDATPAVTLSTVRTVTSIDADLRSGAAYVKNYDTKLLQGTDNQGGGDQFDGMGRLISPTWSDPVGGLPANNVVYDFAHLGGSVNSVGNIVPGDVNMLSTLEQYLRNGNNLDLAFDPDCHYFNDCIKFIIVTDKTPTCVPEPSTVILLGAGLGGLALWRRKDKK